MDHFDCSGWHEDAEFANCQSQISPGYSSSIPLQVTDENMNILSSSKQQLRGFPSGWSSFEEGLGVGDGTAAASSFKSHSEAEKRRRDRINGQLHTLRKLVPKSEKMDKAALLASVIDNVKDLKSKATEVSKGFTVPSDVDEVSISTYVPQEDTSASCQADIFIEATMCCEDRPELLAELGKALQSQKLLIIRAKMACLDCRVQIELLLSSNGSSDNDYSSNNQTGEGMISLKRALNRVANSTQSVTSYRVASKRQRFFLPKPDD
ncbi:unnamed protein product [Rhodiola kirilowii]